MFSVDLPTSEERREIIEIHLKKRNKWNENIDTISLIDVTKGFSGADLESVVKETIEEAFINDKDIITTEDLVITAKKTKSISTTLKDKIIAVKESYKKLDLKAASNPDLFDDSDETEDEDKA